MADKFKAGEMVELKSGGPLMTVEETFPSGNVRCVWFAGEKHQSNVFDIITLKKVTNDSTRNS